MIFTKVVKQAEKYAADNSPALLAGVGVVGALSIAYLTGKATFKAADILNEEKHRRYMMNEPDLTNKERFKLVGTRYIPAAGAVVLTTACIVCSSRIGTRRAAAMAAAYTLSNRDFAEYKEKVIEKLGIAKEQAARDEIAQKRVDNDPVSQRDVIITGNGDVLCYDQPTGRYFKSNMETIRRIQNDLNQQVIVEGVGTLSDLYVMLGLTTTPYSEEVGWTVDKLCELQFSTTLSEDNTPCIVINYQIEPIRGYK